MKLHLCSNRILPVFLCLGLILGAVGPVAFFTPSAEAATSSKAKAAGDTASLQAQIKKVKKRLKKAKRIRIAARKRAVTKRLKKKLKKLRRQLAAIMATPFIEMVTVGNPGNGADSTTYGAVAYVFQIGKYEVSLDEYTVFLNAVAATDTHGLYNVAMQITQSGSAGSFTYAVIGSGKRPVAYVSWFDAARFCNWLHNGRPSGAQTILTTENGAYGLFGATTGVAGFVRGPLAKYWLPSEDEWYKTAYHDPRSTGSGGPPGDDNYWLYPTRSDSPPTAEAPPGVPGTNSANFTGGVGATTDRGAYVNSPSYYGTFDQGGNVREWDNAVIGVSSRGVRGSSWDRSAVRLSSADRDNENPDSEFSDVGFRIASP